MCMLFLLFVAPHLGFFKENPDGALTDFLDFFLTNENRERGARRCWIIRFGGMFCMNVLVIYPAAECRMLHLAFRLSQFQLPFSFVSGCDMVCFMPWNGPYRMLKWCILCDWKIASGRKSLLYRCLLKALIFRVFAPEGKSVRKYALVFLG